MTTAQGIQKLELNSEHFCWWQQGRSPQPNTGSDGPQGPVFDHRTPD
ncbi:hypothetical protein ACQ4N7_16140 [Nodosilinea sp. AN01ver1]